jgi:hypothetical protein
MTFIFQIFYCFLTYLSIMEAIFYGLRVAITYKITCMVNDFVEFRRSVIRIKYQTIDLIIKK